MEKYYFAITIFRVNSLSDTYYILMKLLCQGLESLCFCYSNNAFTKFGMKLVGKVRDSQLVLMFGVRVKSSFRSLYEYHFLPVSVDTKHGSSIKMAIRMLNSGFVCLATPVQV